MGTDSRYGRRDFLKDSLVSFAKTAHEYVSHRDAPRAEAPMPVRTDWARPPGAVAEPLFLERCTKCGDCVDACPYEVLQSHPQQGFPVLFPNERPCSLCEDFPCMAACETQALEPVEGRTEVTLGTAEISISRCTAEQGCHACVASCPVGAIQMDFACLRVVVAETECVGCGLCALTCRTVSDHGAIRIRPFIHHG